MRKRIVAVAIGAVLGLGAFAAAQALPYAIKSDSNFVEASFNERGEVWKRQWTHTGNVVIEVNGVVVMADRAVVNQQNGEVALVGNVRLTLPKSR